MVSEESVILTWERDEKTASRIVRVIIIFLNNMSAKIVLLSSKF
jgi:hypothetical protein